MRKVLPYPRTTSSLSRCVANSVETVTQSHWSQIAKIV
ncbi:hypothetical protein COO91_10728 (plasmid) [Nostoc flagelliforme CCNUN1]|uniref:Uncharacterized protein n=1 Tax=Nostoc flagelliforme CCNUN1 TaxID=2038116 RepID=A0A2K8TA14_9NOSO|nr:hypothetical protein COO91_10728 [Nostoc flagelliforme CCNUN1]